MSRNSNPMARIGSKEGEKRGGRSRGERGREERKKRGGRTEEKEGERIVAARLATATATATAVASLPPRPAPVVCPAPPTLQHHCCLPAPVVWPASPPPPPIDFYGPLLLLPAPASSPKCWAPSSPSSSSSFSSSPSSFLLPPPPLLPSSSSSLSFFWFCFTFISKTRPFLNSSHFEPLGFELPITAGTLFVNKDFLNSSLRNMRAIFCGNLEYDARQSDVERLFKRYGRVDRVDMKSASTFLALPLHGYNIIQTTRGGSGRVLYQVLVGFWDKCNKGKKNQSGLPWHHHPTFPCDTIAFSFFMTFAQHRNHDPLGSSGSPYHFNHTGFAFVYMEDERDAEDAIRRLDRIEFGRKGHRLRIEWTKQERDIRRPGSSRRPSANTRPSKTLFVINFDTIHTRTRDLEKHFEPYGKVLNVRIRRNFAFIHYETQEDATRALDATNLSKLMDRVISVEYAVRDDDDRRNGNSPDRRGRDMSPQRRSYDRGGRSPSPYHRDRGSPDYGHGSRPNARPEQRGSTPYDGGDSPVNARDLSAVLSLLTNILSALTMQSFTSSKRKVSILRSRKRLPSNRDAMAVIREVKRDEMRRIEPSQVLPQSNVASVIEKSLKLLEIVSTCAEGRATIGGDESCEVMDLDLSRGAKLQ
ncbi:hypothetical protein TEA_009745 [Camellia sinensis var. sinensis]|uniref:RRM domain-containing protein n=1 Tax=Camellia sinensis var. sinensis TaxID=542762 RepID=A0A4S4DZT6_CAMSN|nr:hypothetical protein TEA_009745 [Camellia sinensis var. sinensis]